MDLSHGLDKIESSVALQIIEPLVLLRFHFALPRMLFSSCAVHYRVEGSQIHHTSHISRGLLQGWLVSEENEVQPTQGTPCSKPGDGQLPLEEERGQLSPSTMQERERSAWGGAVM